MASEFEFSLDDDDEEHPEPNPEPPQTVPDLTITETRSFKPNKDKPAPIKLGAGKYLVEVPEGCLFRGEVIVIED
jgi:hypothetical protein